MKRIFVFSLMVMVAGAVVAQQVRSMSWAAEGTVTSACQCAVFCSCEFNDKPTFGHCDDVEYIRISKGHYGDVDLSGLRFVMVGQSPKGERMVDTIGKLVFARIYVEPHVTGRQAEALAGVARKMFGTFVQGTERISPDEKLVRAPIEAQIAVDRHRVKIPNVLDLDIETVKGADGKTPIVIANHPFNAYGLGDPQVARSKTYTYRNERIAWNYAGRNASIRSFRMSGDLMAAPESTDAPESTAAHHH